MYGHEYQLQQYKQIVPSPTGRGSGRGGEWNSSGTDLLVHSQAKLNAVARQLNERPRKTLDIENQLNGLINVLRRSVEIATVSSRSEAGL